MDENKPVATLPPEAAPAAPARRSAVRRKRRRRRHDIYVIIIALLALCLAVSIISRSCERMALGRDDPADAVSSPEVSPQVTSISVVAEAMDGTVLIVDPENQTGQRVIFDSAMGQVIIPVMADVAVNTYDEACFSTDGEGLVSYRSGDFTALRGIDVSEHQAEIDWQQVADSGVDYAMIRVGYRGYTAGTITQDAYFARNIEGALAAGLKVGIYFFSQAISEVEAAEEAQYVIDTLSGYDVSFPVAYDWEPIHSAEARTDDLSPLTITQCAEVFCSRVAEAGYKPHVYFSQTYGYLKYDLSELDDYGFWLAQYSGYPDFYYDFDMWQYSDCGSVPGIEGDVDMNISFVDFSKQ